MIYPQIFILCCTYIDRKAHKNNVFTFSNIFKLKKKKSKKNDEKGDDDQIDSTPLLCGLCFENIPVIDQVKCLNTKCESAYHLVCLANSFRAKAEESDELGRKFFLPIDGNCPVCEAYVLWGDVIRKKKGCYKDVNVIEDSQVI